MVNKKDDDINNSNKNINDIDLDIDIDDLFAQITSEVQGNSTATSSSTRKEENNKEITDDFEEINKSINDLNNLSDNDSFTADSEENFSFSNDVNNFKKPSNFDISDSSDSFSAPKKTDLFETIEFQAIKAHIIEAESDDDDKSEESTLSRNSNNANDENLYDEEFYNTKVLKDLKSDDDEYIKSVIDNYSNSEHGNNDYKRKKKRNAFISFLITIGATFAAIFILFTFVIINANVPSGSMKDTINEGDRIIGFRLAYAFSEPQRGDIIIFTPPDEDKLYIKRVIGVPGDEIRISYGDVYVNGEKLEEDYIKEPMAVNREELVYNVPEDSYFVLGDNRNNSLDSRYWSTPYITKDKIHAKAVFKYFDGQKSFLSFSGI